MKDASATFSGKWWVKNFCHTHKEEVRMDHITSHNWKLLLLAGALVGLLAWPTSSEPQTITGQSTAAQATGGWPGPGMTSVHPDTGTLSDTTDARDAALHTATDPCVRTRLLFP